MALNLTMRQIYVKAPCGNSTFAYDLELSMRKKCFTVWFIVVKGIHEWKYNRLIQVAFICLFPLQLPPFSLLIVAKLERLHYTVTRTNVQKS